MGCSHGESFRPSYTWQLIWPTKDPSMPELKVKKTVWTTCVQTLLLRRTGLKGDPGNYEFEEYPYKRLRVIQSEVNQFWRKWSQLAGPNLFVRSKWHTKHRNVAVWDVVWLAEQNALRSQYKLAWGIRVNTDKDGMVRDVHVKTFPSCPVSPRNLTQKQEALPTRIPTTIVHRDVRLFYYQWRKKGKDNWMLKLWCHRDFRSI